MIGEHLLHYRVTAKLGQGGMGVVYRARDEKLDRDVALKVLPPDGTREPGRRRFLQEAKAASALNHPGIVTIYEVNVDRGIDFIAMEYVRGTTLSHVADLPIARALDYVLQMTAALGKAHKSGIVHRDLKPGNVMVTEDHAVKILDFGLAKRTTLEPQLDDDVTRTAPLTVEGSILGTVGYLSPEQARGEAVDGRADIFSLAVMLYELIAGVRPFQGTSMIAVLHSLANDEPRPLSSLRPGIPPAFDAILRHGLAKRRDDRYASMEDFAADLRRAIAGQAVSASADPIVRVPRYRDVFVGRESELAALDRLFREPRMVTLVAGGGTGKTRLAYEAAMEMRERFPDGIFAIELADGGAADVGVRVATVVLGDAPLARAEGTHDPIGTVETYLSRRSALLIMDNCEHVAAVARSIVSRLSRSCPSLSILSTSREVLGVTGEQVIPLAPLSLLPAAALFRERAAAAGGKVDDGGEQRAAVEEICVRLEGLPLAIELAASRVRTLGPVQIATRLGDALKLLRQRAGSGSDRHRSLEATIRWSYNLLDEAERALLARLSVFVGGFDLTAAEGVCGADVLDLIESLVDKSLVAADTAGPVVRYRLHEPIRQFAGERLDEIGQRAAARQAHFAHYLQVAVASARQLDEAPRPALVASLTREHENFLAAIERARADGDIGDAATLSRALHTYWVETGHVAVGATVLQSILDTSPRDPSMLAQIGTLVSLETMSGALEQAERRAVALRAVLSAPLPDMAAGNLRFALGFIESAAGRSTSAFELWSKAGEQLEADPARCRVVWLSAGNAATSAGLFEQARHAYRRAEALPPPVQQWFPSFLTLNRGVTDVLEGARDLAAVSEGLEDMERLGLRFRLLLAAASGSLAFFSAGDIDAADKWWRRGLQLGREMGHLWACWVTLEFAAWSAAVRGHDQTAARLWGAVDAFAQARGYGHWEVMRKERAARIEEVRRRDPDFYRTAAADGAAVPLSQMVDEALTPFAKERAA